MTVHRVHRVPRMYRMHFVPSMPTEAHYGTTRASSSTVSYGYSIETQERCTFLKIEMSHTLRGLPLFEWGDDFSNNDFGFFLANDFIRP